MTFLRAEEANRMATDECSYLDKIARLIYREASRGETVCFMNVPPESQYQQVVDILREAGYTVEEGPYSTLRVSWDSVDTDK